MCLIIKKEAGVAIPHELLVHGSKYNPHGWGIMLSDNGKLYTTKNLHALDEDKEKQEAFRLNELEKLKLLLVTLKSKKLYLHFRKCTSGEVNKENVHPFLFNNGSAALMHNGTMKIWGQGGKSDTYRFTQIMSRLTQNDPEVLYTGALHTLTKPVIDEGMVVILTNTGKEIVLGNRPWLTTKQDGIYLSNFYSWEHYLLDG